jgi:hypothetical protein
VLAHWTSGRLLGERQLFIDIILILKITTNTIYNIKDDQLVSCMAAVLSMTLCMVIETGVRFLRSDVCGSSGCGDVLRILIL